MITDSNLILREGAAHSSGAGEAVALSSLAFPGKHDPVAMVLCVTESYTGGTAMTFTLQQADRRNGEFSAVPGFSLTVPISELEAGTLLPLRHLPRGVTKPWVRLAYSAEGSFSTGSVFCAITRERPEPYEAGMYADRGRIVG